MIKYRFLLVAFVLGLSLDAGAASIRQSSGANAGYGSTAIGFMLGSPTGISVKHWLGGADSFDVGLGAGPGLRLHADYLWGLAQLLHSTGDARLDFYVGAGGLVGGTDGWCSWYDGRHRRRFCDGGPYLGVRIPVGLDLRLRRAPLSFGIEVAPGVAVSPDYADALVDVFFFGRVVL